MGHFELVHFDSPEALAKNAAERLLRFLSGRRSTSLCLSGGRITRLLFNELRVQCKIGVAGSRELVELTDFFWADERCVPASDSESNFGIARQILFDPLNIKSERIHHISGDSDPVFGAKTAEVELRQFAPLNGQGVPMIDLVLLGMGEDGHIASLFPGQAIDPEWIDSVYRPVTGPKPPPRRITLSHRAIITAKETWVLISGRDKERAFASALALDRSIPLGNVLYDRTYTLILSDLETAPKSFSSF